MFVRSVLHGSGARTARSTLDVIRRALEGAGVEFIDENGGGPRRAPQKVKSEDTEKIDAALTPTEATLAFRRSKSVGPTPCRMIDRKIWIVGRWNPIGDDIGCPQNDQLAGAR